MFEMFYRGGPLFMTLITVAGLVALLLAVWVGVQWARGEKVSRSKIKSIPIAGSTAFILGILGQVLGLYQAMSAIQAAGDVSPALIAGGFQVSLITPIYGMILFIITLIIYLIFTITLDPDSNTQKH